MAFGSGITSGVLNTADATKDFTVGGFGTPQAAIIIVKYKDTTPIDTPNVVSVTFYDGTRTRCWSWHDRGGQSTTDGITAASNSACMLNSKYAGEIEYTVGFISNGIRLTQVSSTITSVYVTVILMKGLASRYAGSFAANTTSGNTTVVTSPGFQPDAVLFVGGRNTFQSGQGSEVSDAHVSFGLMTYDGESIVQACVDWVSEDNVATSNILSRQSTTRISGPEQITDTPQELEVTAVGASGFTVTSRSSVSGSQERMYLALEFDTGDGAEIKHHQGPGSTGNQTISGLSIAPGFVLNLASLCTALDSTMSNTNAEPFSMGAFNSSSQRSCGGYSKDNTGTTETYSYADGYSQLIYRATSSLRNRASFVAFTSDGWTWNYGTLNDTSRYSLSLAIGTEGAGARVFDFMPFMPYM